MIGPLLARLSTSVTLVVGKGGVGKTTSAGAIALALADAGQHVHLISTDPAHSLLDLFQQQPAGCSERLHVEEFDARAYADVFFRRIQPALVTLVERGTYLAEDDARAFLDLSVPGIDEVMAALRLVELLRAGERIVIDTAPTGHTLRLLESAHVLRSWVAAGRAMADKSAAVAEQLLHQRVRFEAETVLDEVEQAAHEFDAKVLHAGDFVIVTRYGRVVQAETDRLARELEQRGGRMVARITDYATSSSEGQFVAPRLASVRGCAGLRAWAAALHQSAAPVPAAGEAQGGGGAAEAIRSSPVQLIWVAGKGGVGKSTCAAAIATLLGDTRRSRIVSTDPAGSLSEVFDQPVDAEGVQLGERLHARQVDGIAAFAHMRSQYRSAVERVFAELGLESGAQLDRRVTEALFEFAPPGIDEIIALIEIMEHAAEYDVNIIDSAPTGHFLRLLELPQIALDWVHALIRLLVKARALGSLDALGSDLLTFSKQLRQLKLDLSAPEITAVYVVTLAEPMVIAETRRLCDALAQAQIPVAAIIANRADSAAARRVRGDFPGHRIVRVPDGGAEIIGPTALRNFVNQWEIVGE